jgi:hypothetical protein
MARFGELRQREVQCMAVLANARCRAATRNPNCFCGKHQHLTRVPRFDWVYALEERQCTRFGWDLLGVALYVDTLDDTELELLELQMKEKTLQIFTALD